MNFEKIELPYTIKENDCVLVSHLGRGSYGNVYKATKNTKEKKLCFAFKEYKTCKGNFKSKNYGIGIFEAVLLESFKHPNILKSYGSLFSIVKNETKLFISMQLIIPLKEKLCFATEELLLNWCSELISGMFYLEKKGLCHGDIKPENLGIGKIENLIIYDFSLTFPSDKHNICSTFHYRSPKFLLKYIQSYQNTSAKTNEKNENVTLKYNEINCHFEGSSINDIINCNMWSFGITIICIISRKNDFLELLEFTKVKNYTSNVNYIELLIDFYEKFCLLKDNRLLYIQKLTNFNNFTKKKYFNLLINDVLNYSFDSGDYNSNNLENCKYFSSQKVLTFLNFVHKGKFFMDYLKLKNSSELKYLFDDNYENENNIQNYNPPEYLLYIRYIYHFLVENKSINLFPILFEMAKVNVKLIDEMNSNPSELTALFLNFLHNIFYLTDEKFQYFLDQLKVNSLWVEKIYYDFFNRLNHKLWVRSLYDNNYCSEFIKKIPKILSGI